MDPAAGSESERSLDSPDSLILLIRLHGGMPAGDPSFSYLRKDGVEAVLNLRTQNQKIPPTVPQRGFLSRLFRRREVPEFALANSVLLSVVESQLNEGVRRFIIDLEEVHWLSSAGIGHLVAVWSKISKFKGSLVLITIAPRLLEIFRVTRTDKVFIFAESIEDAVRCLKKE